MGKEKEKISILRYALLGLSGQNVPQDADDTIFTCPFKTENLRAIKYSLWNFEIFSGLGVNFNKCSLWGFNVHHQLIIQGAGILRCDIGRGTMEYLGLNFRINHKKSSAWSELVSKIHKRLARWNDKYFSFGGRITLIKFVLSSISIYCLSFYRIPKKIFSELVCPQRNFILGGE